MGNSQYDSLVSVDSTDCPITKQGECDKAFWSYKIRTSGLRYEVAVCILTGDIVWINGPFPAGDWNDITIFRQALIHFLEAWERVEADAGYLGEDPENTYTPTGVRYMEPKIVSRVRGRVRHRQEAVNDRLKLFKVLGETFCHDMSLHSGCFRAVAVLTQLSFHHGKGLWSVEDA